MFIFAIHVVLFLFWVGARITTNDQHVHLKGTRECTSYIECSKSWFPCAPKLLVDLQKCWEKWSFGFNPFLLPSKFSGIDSESGSEIGFEIRFGDLHEYRRLSPMQHIDCIDSCQGFKWSFYHFTLMEIPGIILLLKLNSVFNTDSDSGVKSNSWANCNFDYEIPTLIYNAF